MKFCVYRLRDSMEPRIGAAAPWDDQVIVDVHRAEVAWLATRTSSRRAHEIAEHLVPAHPGAFLAAGAHVWDFAGQAVVRALPDATTPRDEAVAIPAASCVLLPVLDQLVATGELVAPPPGAEQVRGDAYPVVAIVRRHTHAATTQDAWDAVAGYVDLRNDPLWIRTGDDRAGSDPDLRATVAEVIVAESRHATLLPGDVVSAGSIATAAATAAATIEVEELLLLA